MLLWADRLMGLAGADTIAEAPSTDVAPGLGTRPDKLAAWHGKFGE